jgi:glycosyltransferase involved in cell wall biosynthesis
MVVLLVNKFFYEKGGSERYFFMQSDALSGRGHEVVHFSMSHPDNRPSRWSSYFVARRDYEGVSGLDASLRDIGGFVRSGEAARRIERLITDSRPDVAHLHNIYHQLTPSIIPVLRRHGVPVVMTLHDYKLICPNYRMFAHGAYCERCLGGKFYRAPATRCHDGSLGRSALLALEAYWQSLTGVYDGVYRFVAPSRYLRDTFVRAGFDASRIVYLPSFLPAIEGNGRESGVDGSLPDDYVLFFGRLSAEKGLDTLLDAAALRPEVALVIAGDGPERERLQERARSLRLDHVHFAGHLDKARLDPLVAKARAAVLPSESPENAPFGVLEAALQGVPVVVSDMGGLPEMAAIAGGAVFTHGDAAALADALGTILSDPDAARERARAGRDAVLAHYDRDRHLDVLEAIYSQAVAEVRS